MVKILGLFLLMTTQLGFGATVGSGKPVLNFFSTNGEIQSSHFSLDGRYLTTVTEDGWVWVHELGTKKIVFSWHSSTDFTDAEAVLSPNGKFIAIGEMFDSSHPHKYVLKVFDISSGQIVIHAGGARKSPRISINGDSSRLCYVDYGITRVFDLNTAKEIFQDIRGGLLHSYQDFVSDHRDFVVQIHQASDEIRVFDMVQNTSLLTLPRDYKLKLQQEGSFDRITEDGKAILYTYVPSSHAYQPYNMGVVVYDLKSLAKVLDYNSVGGDFELSPDLKHALYGNLNVRELRDILTNQVIYRVEFAGSNIEAVRFSPDGKYLVANSEDGRIKIYDLSRQREITNVQPQSDGSSLLPWQYLPELKLYMIQGVVFDLNSGQEIYRIRSEKRISNAEISRDGRFMVVTISHAYPAEYVQVFELK